MCEDFKEEEEDEEQEEEEEGGGGRRREGPAETTSFSYVQFAGRELCSAAQGASTGDDYARGKQNPPTIKSASPQEHDAWATAEF